MVPESQLWLAANSEHLPKNAKPIRGMLFCPHAEEKQCCLDGSTVGPVVLRKARQNVANCIAKLCILGELTLAAEPPEGFEYIARSPSPMLERCKEIGGC